MRVTDTAVEHFKTLFPEYRIKGFSPKQHIHELFSFAKKEMIRHRNPNLTTFIKDKMVFRVINDQIVSIRRRMVMELAQLVLVAYLSQMLKQLKITTRTC